MIKNNFFSDALRLPRRQFISGVAGTALAFGALPAFGSSKIKVAGIYTQPIQQKWDARLHLALDAAAKRGISITVFLKRFRILNMSVFFESIVTKVFS